MLSLTHLPITHFKLVEFASLHLVQRVSIPDKDL